MTRNLCRILGVWFNLLIFIVNVLLLMFVMWVYFKILLFILILFCMMYLCVRGESRFFGVFYVTRIRGFSLLCFMFVLIVFGDEGVCLMCNNCFVIVFVNFLWLCIIFICCNCLSFFVNNDGKFIDDTSFFANAFVYFGVLIFYCIYFVVLCMFFINFVFCCSFCRFIVVLLLFGEFNCRVVVVVFEFVMLSCVVFKYFVSLFSVSLLLWLLLIDEKNFENFCVWFCVMFVVLSVSVVSVMSVSVSSGSVCLNVVCVLCVCVGLCLSCVV